MIKGMTNFRKPIEKAKYLMNKPILSKEEPMYKDKEVTILIAFYAFKIVLKAIHQNYIDHLHT